ncbi:MAG TPA: hypothetical protein VMU19_02630 [Bryobacteraceae bacterium]|nr:hypothetical protein [Bryobacteraceae bacterium]
MKNKLMTLAGVLALLAVLGKFYAKPVLASVAAMVQDIDQPARAPFQTTVTVNAISNFNYTSVSIPSGQRLVVDYVSMSGAATSASGNIQPIIILSSTVGGGPSTLYYFAPQANSLVSGQFYSGQNTTIFADTLQVGPAFAGYSPNFLTFNVVISGHLISNP